MKKVILAGNSTTASILYYYLLNDDRYKIVAQTADEVFISNSVLKNVETSPLSNIAKDFPPENHEIIMAAGYKNLNKNRESLFIRLKEMGYCIETYIHPDAKLYSDTLLGEGSIVFPNALIEPHAQVGANTMIWGNVTVAHHSKVGDHCWVAAGTVVSGNAKIKHNCFLGVNSTIVNEVTVGDHNVIGAGALVTRDTRANTVHLARSAEAFRCSAFEYDKFFGI